MFTLGLHFEGPLLRVALLRQTKKKIEIELLKSFEADVKLFDILEPALKGKRVVTVSGLEADRVLIRELNVKLKNRRALLATLPFQVESLIPFALEDTILAPFLYPQKDRSTDVSLVCTTRTFIQQHLESLFSHEVDPDVVSCIPSALKKWAEFVLPQASDFTVFHLGKTRCTWASVQEKRVTASQVIARTEHLGKEIDRTLSYLEAKGKNGDVLIAGEQTDAPALEGGLQGDAIGPFDFSTLQQYAIPIGLALEGLSPSEQRVQFRQGPFLSLKYKEERKRRRKFYFAACAVIALVSWLSTHLFIHQRESALCHELSVSSRDDLQLKIAEWNKRAVQQKQSFSFFSTAPSVSDVLSWLSLHPQLKGIDVQQINYKLIKYPKIGATSVPYVAKVELEFTAPSARLAREFHDALRKGDRMVNAKEEISWRADRETYHTSFTLNSGVSG